MPPPVVVTDPRLDFARRVAPADRDTDVRVLYATTRAPSPPGAPERYQPRPGDRTRLGQAEVQLGEPGWSFADLMASDVTSTNETLRPARLTAVEEFGAMGEDGDRAFVAAVDRQVQASSTGEAVIYVPGYRVTFDQVLVFMGAWAHYLGRSSAVVAFSWPTGTRVWNYFLDCRRAQAFVPDIERLIALVSEKTQARRVNLIAFSCGSPLLAEALVKLRARHQEEDHAALQRRYRIGNALFVAADIDLKTFARAHLPAVSDVAVRTLVYVSKDDGALKWSGFLARASRLGRPNFEELTREDLETALRRVVSSEEELAEMLAEAAGSGVLLEEIAAEAQAAAADEGELRDTFAVFDADGDGRISAEELLAVLASLGDDRCSVEDCRRMIGGVDVDGDGFVCFNEFARMMTQGV